MRQYPNQPHPEGCFCDECNPEFHPQNCACQGFVRKGAEKPIDACAKPTGQRPFQDGLAVLADSIAFP